MPHASLLSRDRTVCVVIDVQEAYRSVLDGWAGVVRHVEGLLAGATILGLPVLVTEQYPKGLGRTAPELLERLPAGTPVIEKMSMSCCGAPRFLEALAATGRRQVLVAGIETHACVHQTVHDLVAAGHEVHVARDATSSRRPALVPPAWERMTLAGMRPTTVEQALLELVRSAEAPEFKPLQRVLKEL